mgnify:FL=1|jgi:hypothetical protein
MATEAYCLTFILHLAGSDAGTTQQTVAIAAGSTDEAVEIAQFYRTGLPSEAVISATIADADGTVLWSEQADGTHDATLLQEDGP